MDLMTKHFLHLFIIISIILIINFIGVESGETCRKKAVNGAEEVFDCPRIFESNKKRFCCGFSPQDKYCCEWSKKRQDIVRNPNEARTLLEGAAAIIILILLIIGGLIVCCCVCACCLMSRKRQSRGQVLGHSRGGTSLTTVNSYPNSTSYPSQQSSYPMQNVAPYPIAEQPPPYNYSQTQPPFNPSYPVK